MISSQNPSRLSKSSIFGGSLLALSILISFWISALWYLPHWDYLPEWFPIPGPRIMDLFKCLQPLILCLFGAPIHLLLLVPALSNLVMIPIQIRAKNWKNLFVLFLGPTLIALSMLPWLFGELIDQMLVRYAISRYNVTINAIEDYRADYGEYPPTLDALVPAYLDHPVGIYMKFGESLTYSPPASDNYYQTLVPFTIELYGHYAGIHGQILKYCPLEYEYCSDYRRIDQDWVWEYSSAL